MQFDKSFFEKSMNRNNEFSVANVPSPTIENFLHDINHIWNSNINLYKRNCQHFASFVCRQAKQDFQLI